MKQKRILKNDEYRKTIQFKIKQSSDLDKINIEKFNNLLLLSSNIYNILIDCDFEVFEFNKNNPDSKKPYLKSKERESLCHELKNSFEEFGNLYSDFVAEVGERYNKALSKCFDSYKLKKQKYKKNPNKYKFPVLNQPKSKDGLDYKSIKSKAENKGIYVENHNIKISNGKNKIYLRFFEDKYSSEILKNSKVCFYQIKRFDENDYRLIISLVSQKPDLSEKPKKSNKKYYNNYTNLNSELHSLNKIVKQYDLYQRTKIKNVRNSKLSKSEVQQKHISNIEKAKTRKFAIIEECLREQALNYEKSLICKDVGIDFGCGYRNSLVLSDGIVISLTSQIYVETAKLNYFRFLFDNKQNKNSGKSKRLKSKITKLEKHIVGIRENWTHKISKWLTQTYNNIAIEDFGSASIVEGNNLSNINKQIYNAAFGSVKFQIAYKCNIQGKNSKLIKPYYTSQICSNPNCSCNYQNFEKKNLDQRLHFCKDCSLTINRDLNSAISILRLSKFRAADAAFEIKFNSIKEILSSE